MRTKLLKRLLKFWMLLLVVLWWSILAELGIYPY